MERSDFVIVGGVAAGPKTAATLARRLPRAQITLFEKDSYISYAGCGLPYFASGDIGSFEELRSTSYGVPRDPAYFKNAKGFDVITGATVARIDRRRKCIVYRLSGDNTEHEHGYGKLVLATGGAAKRPPFPIPDSPLVRAFVRPQDAIFFRDIAQSGKIGKAVIIGGGFIGCELCEALGGLWGIKTTLIEKEDHILPCVLDSEMASLAERELRRNSIDLRTGTTVEKITLSPDGLPIVSLSNGEPLECDIVFYCLGIEPETGLARECGLTMGETGAIDVDSHLATSDPDIYAGGDCVESIHAISGAQVHLPMGSLANRHGRVIAENLAGNHMEFKSILGAFILKVFDLNVGAVGLTSFQAAKVGNDSRAVWGSFSDKPDYYPESKTFSLKMVYRKDGEKHLPLGLQAVGAGDVVRPVDVFSSFLRQKASIDDFFDFEQAYAPPYGEALDPLYHMASLAQAGERGLEFLNPGSPLSDGRRIDTWLDVRRPEEAATEPWKPPSGQLVNLPLETLKDNIHCLDKADRIAIICKRGPRAYQAAVILRAAGFEDICILGGGIQMVSG